MGRGISEAQKKELDAESTKSVKYKTLHTHSALIVSLLISLNPPNDESHVPIKNIPYFEPGRRELLPDFRTKFQLFDGIAPLMTLHGRHRYYGLVVRKWCLIITRLND